MYGQLDANSGKQDYDFMGVGRYLRQRCGRSCYDESSGHRPSMADCLRLHGYRLCVRDRSAPSRLGPSQFLEGIDCCTCTAHANRVFRDSRVSSDESGISRYSANSIWSGGKFAYFGFLVESFDEKVVPTPELVSLDTFYRNAFCF